MIDQLNSLGTAEPLTVRQLEDNLRDASLLNPKPCHSESSPRCHQVMIDQLNSLGTAEPLTVRQLEDNLRDASLSPMVVMMLRMLDSAEIQRRGDFFYPFILARPPAPGLHA